MKPLQSVQNFKDDMKALKVLIKKRDDNNEELNCIYSEREDYPDHFKKLDKRSKLLEQKVNANAAIIAKLYGFDVNELLYAAYDIEIMEKMAKIVSIKLLPVS